MEEMIRENEAKNALIDENVQNSYSNMINRLQGWGILRVALLSVFLLMLILALPSISSFLGDSFNGGILYEPNEDSVITPDYALFHDLLDEGLIKKGQKGFIQSAVIVDSEFLKDAGLDLIAQAHLQNQMLDFVFVSTFHEIQKLDGVVNNGGLVISPLSTDPLTELWFLKTHKLVYLRRFKNAVMVAMRKLQNPSSNRISPEEKKAALKGLEDAYLEPPRQPESATKSSHTGKKIKFLPDLLMDSLAEYPRRVFISDQPSALDWFYENYPTRDREFEVFDLDSLLSPAMPQEIGLLSWLKKNIRREDYVVMKAEAQVVEKMIRDKTLCLVDELFLECKNQWQDGEVNGTKRAYWQCLTLYGKVRDEGVAVHRWWN